MFTIGQLMDYCERIWAGKALWVAVVAATLAGGCDFNHSRVPRQRHAPAAPAQSNDSSGSAANPEPDGPEPALSDIIQLTGGFSRAGEAYFSADGRWIIFQATPPGEEHYQM